jgi:hypothetical protein
MKWQLLLTMVPLRGQKQASLGATRHAEVTVAPELSMAVQLVQWVPMAAAVGVMSSTALSSIAPKLPSRSIFFCMWIFSFRPFGGP